MVRNHFFSTAAALTGGRAGARQLPPWGYKIRTLRQVRADKIEADDPRVCGTDESI